MSAQRVQPFEGFSGKTLSFLRKNRAMNSKAWFEKHRPDYERHVLGPLRDLAMAVSGTIIRVDREIDTTPSLNRVISRIYRDTRFSKDKSLFREDVWLSYKRRVDTKLSLPEFYFYMTQEHYEYGMGYYSASRATMDLIRATIADGPAAFRNTIAFTKKRRCGFELSGPEYKRPIVNNAPADLQGWFELKSFCYVHRSVLDSTLFSPRLARDIGRGFETLGPLYRYLIKHTVPVNHARR